MDLGSEIYSIRDVKRERAVLFVARNYTQIYYRVSKVTADEKEPINLTVSDVFSMISNNPRVSAVELRSEEDGSWMRTSADQSLLKLINDELPGLSLLNSGEIGNDIYSVNYRIPANLMFDDGAALNMQVYPEKGYAYIFGGYIPVSPELCAAIKALSDQDGQYPSISELLPYVKSEISYLYFKNQTDGAEVLCKNPEWSREAWFNMLDYYRVEEAQDETNGRLVMTCVLGKSETECVNIDFYESQDSDIIIKFNDCFYKPVKGRMTYRQLNDFLYNSTDLGLAP